MTFHTLTFSFGEGAPEPLAQAAAVTGHVDWHQVAKLVRHGYPPRLARHIVR